MIIAEYLFNSFVRGATIYKSHIFFIFSLFNFNHQKKIVGPPKKQMLWAPLKKKKGIGVTFGD